MVTFDTTQYKFSHGRKPRGWGVWMFQVGTLPLMAFGSYTNAKKQAAAQAREIRVTTVKVLP